jgi:hypothetical protein
MQGRATFPKVTISEDFNLKKVPPFCLYIWMLVYNIDMSRYDKMREFSLFQSEYVPRVVTGE